MNPRSFLRLALVVGIIGLSWLLWHKYRTTATPEPQVTVPVPTIDRPPVEVPPQKRDDQKIAPAPLKKGQRVFYGPLPRNIKGIDQLPMANRPTSTWPQKLEAHLRQLGGKNLKTLKIKPEESYVIPDGQSGRYVERVVIQLTGSKGEYTSFFAEVDSETGHVLKSWGAAIPESKAHR